MQVGGDLGEVVAGEVAAVVGVEHVGDAVHRPPGIGLAPDRLAQRQRQVQRRRCAEEHRVAGDRAGAVVLHDGQPRPGRGAVGVEDEQVEFGVVGLPDHVRALGLAAVDQFVAVPQRHRAVMGESEQVRVQLGDDRVHGAVGRDRPALRGRAPRDPAGDGGHRRPRSIQRQALDEPDQLGGNPSPPAVGDGQRGQDRPDRRRGSGPATAAPCAAAPRPRGRPPPTRRLPARAGAAPRPPAHRRLPLGVVEPGHRPLRQRHRVSGSVPAAVTVSAGRGGRWR